MVAPRNTSSETSRADISGAFATPVWSSKLAAAILSFTRPQDIETEPYDNGMACVAFFAGQEDRFLGWNWRGSRAVLRCPKVDITIRAGTWPLAQESGDTVNLLRMHVLMPTGNGSSVALTRV